MTKITVHAFNHATGDRCILIRSVKTDAPEDQQEWQKTPQYAATEDQFYKDVPDSYVAPGLVEWDGATVSVWRHFTGVWAEIEMIVTQGWYGIAGPDLQKHRTIRVRVNCPSVGANSWSVDSEDPIEHKVTGGTGNHCEISITLTGQIELTQAERIALRRVIMPANGPGKLAVRVKCPISVGNPDKDVLRAIGLRTTGPQYFWATFGDGPDRYLVAHKVANGFDGIYAGSFAGRQDFGTVRHLATTIEGDSRMLDFVIEGLPTDIPLRLEAEPNIEGWSGLPDSGGACDPIANVTRCGYGITVARMAGRSVTGDEVFADRRTPVRMEATGEWYSIPLIEQHQIPKTIPKDWQNQDLRKVSPAKSRLVLGGEVTRKVDALQRAVVRPTNVTVDGRLRGRGLLPGRPG